MLTFDWLWTLIASLDCRPRFGGGALVDFAYWALFLASYNAINTVKDAIIYLFNEATLVIITEGPTAE